MKSRFYLLLTVLGWQLASGLTLVSAQNTAPLPEAQRALLPSLPALQAEPAIIAPHGVVTLRLAANATMPNPRLRVGLFEPGHTVPLADGLRDFRLIDGNWQTTLTVQAESGLYELRIISNDRLHTPLSRPASLEVPGIRREAGWWLLNGSPFAELPNGPASTNALLPNAPFFVPGLKRDLRQRDKITPHSLFSPTPLVWNTVKLAPLSSFLVEKRPLDVRAIVADAIHTAQMGGSRNNLGFELPVDAGADGAPLPPVAAGIVAQLRQAIDSQASGAALILSVDVDSHHPPASEAAVEAISAYGALCDALVLQLNPASDDAWPVKAARRLAEEQPNYDLPIFVRWQSAAALFPLAAPAALDYWMSGATGFIGTTPPALNWESIVLRNLPLFVGSVTLEDISVLPTPNLSAPAGSTTRLYETLRGVGRVPQLARLVLPRERDKRPESFAVALGDRISVATVEQFKAMANGGGRVYLEGTPLLDERGQPAWNLASLVGAAASAMERKQTMLTLEDPWTFGRGHGARLAVEQAAQVKLNPGLLTNRLNKPIKPIKPQPGLDVLTGPRVVARLADGSPGIIVTPVGQGEVIWLPYRILLADAGNTTSVSTAETPPLAPPATAPDAQAPAHNRNTLAALATPLAPDQLNFNRATPMQRYYTAIASTLGTALVEAHGVDMVQAGAEAVRVAVRRSTKGTLLVALLNTGQTPASIAVAVGNAPGLAVDLADETELPLDKRGFQSAATTTIPAGGWKLIAFAASRKAFDLERNTSRLQGRLR